MARRSPKASSSETIQKLLDERKTLGEWIERLDKAADDTPEDVQQKVRGDYTRRLESVAKQLRGFTSELKDALQEKTRHHIELYDREAGAKNRLAEAQLRHTVGEVDDEQWSETQSEIEGELESTRRQLADLDDEISGLEGVMASIGDEGEADEPGEESEEKGAEPQVKPSQEERAEPKEERAEPKAKEEKAPAKPASKAPDGSKEPSKDFNEMEFLQSLGEKTAKTKERPTGASFKPATRSTRDSGSETRGKTRGRRTSQHLSKKSLKCPGCGVLNLPTEWYCESCGAELSVV